MLIPDKFAPAVAGFFAPEDVVRLDCNKSPGNVLEVRKRLDLRNFSKIAVFDLLGGLNLVALILHTTVTNVERRLLIDKATFTPLPKYDQVTCSLVYSTSQPPVVYHSINIL